MNAKRSSKINWLIIVVIFILLVYMMNYYTDVEEDRKAIKNILDLEVPLGESIFFLETLSYFQKTEKIGINPRTACAIESAAKWHPKRQIFVFYASHSLTNLDTAPSDKYIQILSTYHNIHFGHINVKEFGRGTPVETLIEKKIIEKSEFKIAHFSDMLRILTLWRYGGIYLDTDVIVLKSFDDLAENFVGIESSSTVASGLLGFSHTGVGHDYIASVVKMFGKNYNYQIWAANGPTLFTDLAKRVCKVEKIEEVIGKECDKLHIYPQEYFYPVYYPSWRLYFDEQHAKKVDDMIKNSYAIHVWNKLSSEEKININSSAAYLNVARKNCPRVISAVEDYF